VSPVYPGLLRTAIPVYDTESLQNSNAIFMIRYQELLRTIDQPKANTKCRMCLRQFVCSCSIFQVVIRLFRAAAQQQFKVFLERLKIFFVFHFVLENLQRHVVGDRVAFSCRVHHGFVYVDGALFSLDVLMKQCFDIGIRRFIIAAIRFFQP